MRIESNPALKLELSEAASCRHYGAMRAWLSDRPSEPEVSESVGLVHNLFTLLVGKRKKKMS